MKTIELSGAALDWAVAKAEGTWEGLNDERHKMGRCYSTNWALAGPIIERERIQITPRGETTDMWEAIIFDNIFMDDGSDCFQTGTTPLIAAMRCYVASKLGDEVQLPEELI